MRKKFVFYFLAPLSILLLVFYLFVDRWIESALESAGESIVGAKVEIDNLRLTLSPIAVEFARLQVASPKDPWKNIVETGRVRFALNFDQLLRGKYIIETMEINNAIVGTKRSTNGSLPKRTAPKNEQQRTSFSEQAQSVIASKAKASPVFDLGKLKQQLKIDSLLNIHNLKTVQHIDTLKAQVQQASQRWQAVVTDLERSKQRFAEIESNVKSINLQELKTLESITSAIAKVNDSYKAVNEINQTFKTSRNAITGEINGFSTSLGAVDDIAKEDYRAVTQLAKLPDLSTRGIAEMVLGKSVLEEVNYYLSWVDFARTTVPKYMPKPEYEPEKRFEGQTIHFPQERNYPKFWIKNIILSGGTDKAQDPNYLYIRGQAQNITNNQHITGFPLTVAFAGTKGGNTSVSFDAMFDRRKEIPVDHYKATATGLPVSTLELGQADFIPSKINNAQASLDVEISIPGNQFDSNINVDFTNITMSFEQSPRNDVERIVRDVLEAVRAFNLKLRFWNTGSGFDMAFATDLDNQLAAQAQKIIGSEIAKFQNEIRAKVNERIAEKRKEFEALYDQKKNEVMARLKSYETLVNEKVALVEAKKKELQDKVDQEKKKQTDSAKKKLEDTLKGLFKKQ